jgi:hypothetical protein
MGKKPQIKTFCSHFSAITEGFYVGATGLEPMTSCTPCKRATRLRHAPKDKVSIANPLYSRKTELSH